MPKDNNKKEQIIDATRISRIRTMASKFDLGYIVRPYLKRRGPMGDQECRMDISQILKLLQGRKLRVIQKRNYKWLEVV